MCLVYQRSDAVLVVAVAVFGFSVGCAAGRRLEPSVLQAMADRYPEWVDGDTTKIQPPGMACSLGFASGLSTEGDAVSSARNVALADLISEVVVGLSGSTEIQQMAAYADGRTREEGSIKQHIQTKVRGRLQNAKTVEKFWQKRVRYLHSGKSVEYDAWAFICVPEETLRNAYRDEVKRAAEVTARVTAAVDEQVALLQAEPDGAVHAFALYKRSLEELGDLIDAGAGAYGSMDKLRRSLVGETSFSVVDRRESGERGVFQYSFFVAFGGRPLDALEVVADAPCISGTPVAASCDGQGGLVLTVTPSSRFADCEVEFRPLGLESLAARLRLEPEFVHATLACVLNVSGFVAADVRSHLSQLTSNLTASHPALRGKGNAGGEVARLQMTISVSVNTPSSFAGNLLRSHGAVQVQIQLVGSNVATLLERQHAVVAVGSNATQLATNMAVNTEKLAKEDLAEVLGEM